MDTTTRCRTCGAVDLARATTCKRCGAQLASDEPSHGANANAHGPAGGAHSPAGGAYSSAGGAYGANANAYRPYPPPRPAASASSLTKSCPVCFHPCARSASACPACGHRFPGLRARYIVVPLSFAAVLLLFAGMRYFDERAKETRIRNIESGIAQQYGIVDTTVHPKPQKPWFWSLFRSRPTVAEIFEHNLEVSGGADAVGRVKSYRSTGRLNFSTFDDPAGYGFGGRPQAPPAKYTMRAKAPNKIEMECEMYVSTREGSGTRLVRRGFDGSRGWEYVETSLTQYGDARPPRQSEFREFTGAELEQMKHYGNATGLVRLADEYGSLVLMPNQRISTMEFYGVKEFERECYVVRGLNAEKKFETLYFDVDTGLLARFDFEAQGPDGPVTVECYPDTYKEVDKVVLPFRLTFKLNSLRATMLFDEFKLNEPIDDSTFSPPASS